MGFFDFLKQANINQGIEEYKKTAGAVLLDVRTPQEYQEGHIPESKNVPLQQLNNVVSVVKNTEIPLFVYCYSGARSRQATGMLQRMGYSKVNNIGGIAAVHMKYFIMSTITGVFRQIHFLSKMKKFNSLFSVDISRLLTEKQNDSFDP